MIPTSLNRLMERRSVLLLQGPMGPFFAKLAQALRTPERQVLKVNFNAGDDYFYREPGTVRFDKPMTLWPEFFVGLLERHQIDAVVLFGQMRDMHRYAIELAKERKVAVYVFEEGYIRPDYVTLEEGGVNAESSISRDPEFYRHADIEPMPAPQPTGQQFGEVADIAMTYAWHMWRGRREYPHYVHHRGLHPINEGIKWVRGAWRKYHHGWTERHILPLLTQPEHDKRFFLVPLQVYNDSQIRCHSRFMDVAEFITSVIESFAKHAPGDKWLVLKHHPLDRPYNNYRFLINEVAREWGVTGRVFYIHDQHLPTLLRHACGVVTINSTTGLQSLYHGTPVKVLGECFYAVEGLVNTGPLAEFWHQPGQVDRALFMKFRAHLIRETQLNASFYAQTPGLTPYSEAAKRAAAPESRFMTEAQNSVWSPSTLPTLK